MKYMKTILCVLMINMGTVAALAGPSSNRIKDGPGLFDSLFEADDKTVTSKPHAGEQQQPLSDAAVADATVSASPAPVQTGLFDGIWLDQHGQLLMLKQIHRNLFLSASSKHAAWQAQCIVTAAAARCIGDGMSDVDGGFSYEGHLSIQGDGSQPSSLKADWTIIFHNGNKNAGHSIYQKRL